MRRWLIVSIGVTAAATAASLLVYANRVEWLPERVPTHWNASFKPDGYTSRDNMLVPLLLMPLVSVSVPPLALRSVATS